MIRPQGLSNLGLSCNDAPRPPPLCPPINTTGPPLSLKPPLKSGKDFFCLLLIELAPS